MYKRDFQRGLVREQALVSQYATILYPIHLAYTLQLGSPQSPSDSSKLRHWMTSVATLLRQLRLSWSTRVQGLMNRDQGS